MGPPAEPPKTDCNPSCVDEYNFPVDRLRGLHLTKNLIDGGSFGRVYRVEAVGIMEGQDTTTVAVKMLRGSYDCDVSLFVCLCFFFCYFVYYTLHTINKTLK